MGIILIPIFLLDILLMIYVFIHIFMMQTLPSASWQNAMMVGAGISLLLGLPMLFFKPSSSGSEAAMETGQNFINLMVVLIAFPAFLVFVLSFFPASWRWFHFIEGVLGAIAAGTFTLLVLYIALSILIESFKKKS